MRKDKNEAKESEELAYSSKIHASYGLGGFHDNFFTASFSITVIYFFEVELLLGSALVGLAFVIYGLWNMFNDPLAGYLSDRNYRFTKRLGRRFPWIITSAIPYAIVYFLIFLVPFNDIVAKFIWLTFIICFFDFFYSFWFTNWISLFPDKFRSDSERKYVGAYSTLSGQIGIALGMLLPTFIIKYGDVDSYVVSAIVFMIIGLVVVVLMIPGIREDKGLKEHGFLLADYAEEKESYVQTLKFAMKQKNFVVYVFTYLAQMVLFMLILGSISYWVRYILIEEKNLEFFISAAFLIGSLVSVPLWLYIGRKLGNRLGNIIGAASASIVLIFLMFTSSLELTIIGTALIGLTVGSLWTLMYPTFSDVIDEIVVKTGKRKEGAYTGIRTFFGRSSNIIGAIVISVVHIATGFIPEAEIQTESALFGIRVIIALVPMLFYLAASILMWRFYDLTPEKVEKIQAELRKLKL